MITFENHAFKGLDASLTQLFSLQQSMAAQIDQLVALLPRGLDVADPETFAQAKVIDKEINDSELAADTLVAEIINKYTPMGEELRFILGSVKAAGALERAADKIKNCIKRLAKVNHPLDAVVREELEKAIAAVKVMIAITLGQMVDYKEEVAAELLKHGAVVQASYRTVLIQLRGQHVATVPSDSTHIILVAKNLDQAADIAIEIMKVGHYVNFGTKYEKQKD